MATKTESVKRHDHHTHPKTELLPVTLLGGFLGAGKTTLLKHILETKHKAKGEFKCAVIVNDMAELNVDKSLIDKSALVQSDEVIAMQNGCVCCTLKSDLIDQIIEMALKKCFDYMIIEASGVSEVGPMAALFAECDDEHDHDEHAKPTLNEVARLDTCVTVVDSAEFFSNFETVRPGSKSEIWPQLMVEQMEYANVIILNKTDLVSPDQLTKINDQVSILNTKAKIVHAQNSTVDVMQVVNTHLYNPEDFNKPIDVDITEEKVPDCCKASLARGETACCKRARTFDSGLSQVILGSKRMPKTRHKSRFGITSFLYKARRPFHPKRFFVTFVERFFMFVERNVDHDEDEDDEEEEEEEGDDATDKVDKKIEEVREASALEADAAEEQSGEDGVVVHHGYTCDLTGISPIVGPRFHQDGTDFDICEEAFNKLPKEEQAVFERIDVEITAEVLIKRKQEEAKEKQTLRCGVLGDILRSKGFIWMANSHDLQGCFGQAGNMVTIESSGTWNALDSRAWVGTEEEKSTARKIWVAPYADRRQELVFIGTNMKHSVIQDCLDDCLLTDEEFSLGTDGWKATIGDLTLGIRGTGTEAVEK